MVVCGTYLMTHVTWLGLYLIDTLLQKMEFRRQLMTESVANWRLYELRMIWRILMRMIWRWWCIGEMVKKFGKFGKFHKLLSIKPYIR